MIKRRTGSTSVPQVFIGGHFEGGCVDIINGLKSGQLQTRLQEHGVCVDPAIQIDPYELLPKWQLPR